MVQSLITDDDAPAEPPADAARARWSWRHTLVMVIIVLGVGVFVYPSAASWFSSIRHHGEVDGYVRSIESLADDLAAELVQQAQDYNRRLPDGPIRDPYVLTVNGEQTAIGEGADAYFDTLVFPGTDTMARVRIPAIGVDLPVYHGTDPATLGRGIGHLFGSALPVGGVGSHSVLTGHSGLPQATFFDDLGRLSVGDLIVINVAGQELHYKIDQMMTVLPDQTEQLRKGPGHDYLTLITCTPTGVNTHRLLVRAERVDESAAAESAYEITDATEPAGFPWWALALIGVPLAAFFGVKPGRRAGSPENDQAAPAEHPSAG